MDCSSDQQLLGDIGETDIHIKKKNRRDLHSSLRCPQIKFITKQIEEYLLIRVLSSFFFGGGWIDAGEIDIIRNNAEGEWDLGCSITNPLKCYE